VISKVAEYGGKGKVPASKLCRKEMVNELDGFEEHEVKKGRISRHKDIV